jgi:hypothetical protein
LVTTAPTLPAHSHVLASPLPAYNMRAAALLAAAALLLAAAAPLATAASPAISSCALLLDNTEVNRLGAALSSSPKKYLNFGPDGKTVTGVNSPALTADGFSPSAVLCMELTYNVRAPGGGGSVPTAPAPGVGIPSAQQNQVYAFFARRSNAAAWRTQATSRFGKKVGAA